MGVDRSSSLFICGPLREISEGKVAELGVLSGARTGLVEGMAAGTSTS